MRKQIIMAIDPDSGRNGLAILTLEERKLVSLDAEQLTFGATLKRVQELYIRALSQGIEFVLLVEAGWLNKGNYHIGYGDNLHIAAAKGVAQGRNHQTGLDIVDYCQYNKIPVEEVKPLAKRSSGMQLWRGRDGKITQDELEELTGQVIRVKDKNGKKARPNQEARDAVLIAWTRANLPVKMRTRK